MLKPVFYSVSLLISLSLLSACSSHERSSSIQRTTRQAGTPSSIAATEPTRQIDPALADTLKNQTAMTEANNTPATVPSSATTTLPAVSEPPVITTPPATTVAITQPTLATPVLQSMPITEDVNEPPEFKGIVSSHNQWRQKVNVPALRWSTTVAATAQAWANQLQTKGCPLEHSSQHQYGENIAAGTGMSLTPEGVVALWASEVGNYDYAMNRCATGKVCGHYTQIVWQSSTEVGCGKASCGNQEVWVCNYNPAGNYVGRKPY
ncbi:uncharacterized protein with SCP/PR1 domains [Beggiatoa alba B18LD]|uniref:Uncharacterized protein with SCP/PR1 domains n=1 Tax=Beggiatoa alba B18LD TaxID=395493 RepID=I3CJT6_9GAMM|nr:pathogenesis-related family 1 protein [Beggiatoa alba]EIJ43879.1 uncharacterized protein with SCP/PR1 domains [Beggiatoa alba B18LD]